MISLNKFMTEVKNKLKRLEDKKYVKDNLSLNGTWTAPYDGIVTCNGRATAAGAYFFAKMLQMMNMLECAQLRGARTMGRFVLP